MTELEAAVRPFNVGKMPRKTSFTNNSLNACPNDAKSQRGGLGKRLPVSPFR